LDILVKNIKKIAIIATLIFCSNLLANDKSVFSQTPEEADKKIYNPVFTASLSLVPGGGQLATKNFAKGFLFLGTEGIIGWISVRGWVDYHESFDKIYLSRDSLNAAKYKNADTAYWANAVALAEYDNLFEKVRYYNASALFGAIGIWNILDAVGVSNAVKGAQNPNPRKAMALSAIPFSGAGQFYNGEWFKAGLVIATQTAFVFGGTQFQYLMYKSQKYVEDLNRNREENSSPRIDNNWRNNYENAARRRTMFFWYSIIFYMYGMTDAYVDASLSNFEKKFDISASFSPIENEIAFGFVFKFGSR